MDENLDLCVADDGTLKQASQLFDPENELLVRIFADEPVFPAERFQTPAWRQVRMLLPILFIIIINASAGLACMCHVYTP